MMTFKEFLSQDQMPLTQTVKFGGLQVGKIDAGVHKPPSFKPPTPDLGVRVPLPSTGLTPTKSQADRPIPTKPHRFLPRKGSTLRKGF